jgi:hypothetical protein
MTPFLWWLVGYIIGLGMGFYITYSVLQMQGRLK